MALMSVPGVGLAGEGTDALGGLAAPLGGGGLASLRALGASGPLGLAGGGLALSPELEEEMGSLGQGGMQAQLMELFMMLQQLYLQLEQALASGDRTGAKAAQQQIQSLEQQLGGGAGAGGGGGYVPAVSGGGGAGGGGYASSGSGGGGGGSASAGSSSQASGPPPSFAPGDSNGRVQAMVDKANSLVGQPYVVGGGHGGWGASNGYDCSGFVSAVLHAGGYLNSPVDTTALPSQAGIDKGPGQHVTIYDRALPGQEGHVIIDINGQFYESGGMHGSWGGGGGVEKIGRPSDSYLQSFGTVLHPHGL